MYFHLKQHIRKVHEEKESNNFHIDINAIHNDQKQYDEHEIATNINDKSIANANNFKEHDNVIHVGHKNQKCNFCGKLFSQEGSLQMHIHLIHEDDKDCNCKFCGKSFFDARNLKRHIHTIHEGHKDYKCESCEKLFSDIGNLKKHIHNDP